MKLNWVLVCVESEPNDDMMVKVLHACAYEEEPQDIHIEALRKELSVDEELGMVGETNYIIVKYGREENPDIFETLELPEELPA